MSSKALLGSVRGSEIREQAAGHGAPGDPVSEVVASLHETPCRPLVNLTPRQERRLAYLAAAGRMLQAFNEGLIAPKPPRELW